MSIKSGLLIFVITLALSACGGGQSNYKRDKADKDIKQASLTNVQLAVGYLRRGKYEIAQEKLYKAIEQDSDNVTAYTTMAFLLMQINKLEEAEEYYLDALDIKENDPELRNGYGTYLCRVRRTNDAMEQFELAYNNPFYKTAYLAHSNAGMCLLQAGKYEPAEKMLRHALKLQPELSTALISMAELAVKTERFMMGRAYVQRYHAINRPSAESLWVQVQVERSLGAEEHYLKAANQLMDAFSDSEQAGKAEALVRDDRIERH